MKIQVVITFIKCVSSGALLLAVVILSSMTIGAQTKRGAQSYEEFSVPCAKALRIGLVAVKKLHSKEMERWTKGDSDSDTELVETQGALKNYLACRRADTTAKLKKLTADDRKQINSAAENALRIARMRVDLMYGVSFDEKFDDPVNFTITQNAVALVEDYKGVLASVYGQKKTSNALGSETAAERDRKQIGTLLAQIEKIANEQDEAADFAMFKTTIEKTLREIKNEVGTEKVVTTAFLVRLLEMNLADENGKIRRV